MLITDGQFAKRQGSATRPQGMSSGLKMISLRHQLSALRNKADLGKGIYCHFILEITK
jgi:hypothetical protein